jgi:hypothetical protein
MDLRGVIQNNFRLKVVSALLATGIWYSIHFFFLPIPETTESVDSGIATTRTMKSLRVLVRMGANNVIPVVVDPVNVDAEIRGPQEIVRGLRAEDIDVFVDISQIRLFQEIQKKLEYRVRFSSLEVELLPDTVSVRQVSTPKED